MLRKVRMLQKKAVVWLRNLTVQLILLQLLYLWVYQNQSLVSVLSKILDPPNSAPKSKGTKSTARVLTSARSLSLLIEKEKKRLKQREKRSVKGRERGRKAKEGWNEKKKQQESASRKHLKELSDELCWHHQLTHLQIQRVYKKQSWWRNTKSWDIKWWAQHLFWIISRWSVVYR